MLSRLFFGSQTLMRPRQTLAESENNRVSRSPKIKAESRRELLTVRNLSLGYGEKTVIERISLGLRSGELLGIIGPNGSGKSTLLKGIIGSLRPTEGEVLVDGVPTRKLGPRAMARKLALVSQSPNLPEGFNVFEIALLGRAPWLGPFASEGERDYHLTWMALEATGVFDLAHRQVSELSGGERQRVIIARALAQDTPMLLFDEPTAHLDTHHQGALLDLLRTQTRADKAAIAVLHDLNLAAQFCDRLILIESGRIVAEGLPDEVLTSEIVQSVYGREVRVFAHPENGLPLAIVSSNQEDESGML